MFVLASLPLDTYMRTSMNTYIYIDIHIHIYTYIKYIHVHVDDLYICMYHLRMFM